MVTSFRGMKKSSINKVRSDEKAINKQEGKVIDI